MSDPVGDEPFEQDGAGVPDGFQRLWMPHRMAYIKGENRATSDSPDDSGHLMICPYRHVADYTELDEAETIELAEHTKLAMTALRAASGAQGFNIGMNMGGVAGAGIAAHLHQHVVPRWGGDTNFMPVVAGVKVLPQLLGETREMLAAAWPC